MEIVAEYQGIDADQAMWRYFRRHWLGLFPGLSSRCAFVRQAANLWQYKELLQQRLADQLGAFIHNVHLVDGIPIPRVALVVHPVVEVARAKLLTATVQRKGRPIMAFRVTCSSAPLA
jgi:hypothetical protein